MATSFFQGSFYVGGFFKVETPSVKKGGNWKSRRKQDEQVIMAFLHAYMQQQSHHRRCLNG